MMAAVRPWRTVVLPSVYAAAVVWAFHARRPESIASADRTIVTVSVSDAPAALNAPEPIYPEAALRAGIQGPVKVHVKIDARGEVAGARALSGPPELAPAALDAVRQYQFMPGASEADVEIPFHRDQPGPRTLAQPVPIQRAPAKSAQTPGVVRVIAMIDAGGSVEFAHPVSGPAALFPAAVESVRQWKFRPLLRDGQPDRGAAVVDVNVNRAGL